MLFDQLFRRPSYLTSLFKPRISNPTGDLSVEIYEPESFLASAYKRSGGKDEHLYSVWQISTNAEFTDIVFDSGQDTTNLESIAVSDTGIVMLETYFIRVKYANDSKESDWSNTIEFKTALFESVINAWNDTVFSSSFLGFE